MQSDHDETERDIDADGVVLAAQIDDNGSTTSFAYGVDTTRTVRRALQLGLATDEIREYSTADRRDKVRALANAIGYSLGEIELEYEAESTTDFETSPLDEEWPYEHVQPGEVEQYLSAHEAKALRQELEDLRAKVDEWACDDCGEQKSVVWRPASDENLCRDCAGFEDGDEQ